MVIALVPFEGLANGGRALAPAPSRELYYVGDYNGDGLPFDFYLPSLGVMGEFGIV